MNKVIGKFLLAGDKFLSELHLRQPGFTDSGCRSFTKYHKRIQKFRETGDLKHIQKNELVKVCFTHNAAYPHSEDLGKRFISVKILTDRAYEITINSNYVGYQRESANMAQMF